MKKSTENIDKAFQLKGKRLTVTEAQLVHLMGEDEKYEMYLDDNGNIAFKLK